MHKKNYKFIGYARHSFFPNLKYSRSAAGTADSGWVLPGCYKKTYRTCMGHVRFNIQTISPAGIHKDTARVITFIRAVDSGVTNYISEHRDIYSKTVSSKFPFEFIWRIKKNVEITWNRKPTVIDQLSLKLSGSPTCIAKHKKVLMGSHATRYIIQNFGIPGEKNLGGYLQSIAI